eukprot:TRINITY_DN4759_c0_g4_i1.p1 TRINITY_DN4759_c0_g4~~TRINITY_DN4759_c0_g4_i1.p1  ORF type:complete len:1254 (-),score=383.99 TRINITY_DN4759_c0_g4_i1:186-3401(-)
MGEWTKQISDVLLKKIAGDDLLVSKRAVACVASFTHGLNDGALGEFIKGLTMGVHHDKASLQAISAVASSVGFRMGNYLSTVGPMFIGLLEGGHDISEEERDEQRECCFAAFEQFVNHCPSEVAPFAEKLVHTCAEFIAYDPNFSYDDIVEESEEEDYYDSEFEDFDDYGYDDDSDNSWKVRKASTRLLKTLIIHLPFLLPLVHKEVAEKLIICFREREESVRLDIVECFTILLDRSAATKEGQDILLHVTDLAHKTIDASFAAFQKGKGSLKAKIVLCLCSLTRAMPTQISSRTSEIMEFLLENFDESSEGELCFEVASCFQAIIETQEPVRESLPRLCKCLKNGTSHEWVRVVCKNFEVIVALARQLTAPEGMDIDESGVPEIANDLMGCVFPMFLKSDLDHEVKSMSILAASTLLTCFAQELTSNQTFNLNEFFVEFARKLKNETTRIACLKTVPILFACETLLPMLQSYVAEFIDICCIHLKQTSRIIRQQSLFALKAMVHRPSILNENMMNNIINQIASSISGDVDFLLCQFGMEIISDLVNTKLPHVMSNVVSLVFPLGLKLLVSPLLQKNVLIPLTLIFKKCIEEKCIEYNTLLEELMKPVQMKGEKGKTVIGNLSKVMAEVAISSGNPEGIINSTLAAINSTPGGATFRLLISMIGQMGKSFDMTRIPEVWAVVINGMKPSSELQEEEQIQASNSAGQICVGNMDVFFPQLLAVIGEVDKYLLLVALLQVIDDLTLEHLSEHLEKIWNFLVGLLSDREESARKMVSECISRLVTIFPEILERLSARIMDTNCPRLEKSCIMAGLNNVFHHERVQKELAPLVESFLAPMQDCNDLALCRSALILASAIAQNAPMLLHQFCFLGKNSPSTDTTLSLSENGLFQLVFTAAAHKSVRVVNYGPFKQNVDDGIPLRKAAFQCLQALMQNLPSQVPIGDCFACAKTALGDCDEIKIMAHNILALFSQSKNYAWNASIVQDLDELLNSYLLPTIDAIHSREKKRTAVTTDLDYEKMVVSSSFKLLNLISKIPGVSSKNSWCNFTTKYLRMERNTSLLQMFNSFADSVDTQ